MREEHNSELVALVATPNGYYASTGISSDPITGQPAIHNTPSGVHYRSLPSVFSHWAFWSIPVIILFAFFYPFLASYLSIESRRYYPKRVPVFLRAVAEILAVIFFIGFGSLELLAQESQLYSQLEAQDWGRHDSVTTYQYDANGSLTQKVTTEPAKTTTESFDYNLENRLSKHTKTVDDGTDVTVTASQYTYNQSGIRIKKGETVSVNGQQVSEDTKVFLIDSYNHTGYAQVLEEFDGGSPTPVMSYTIGDDVISQTKGTSPLPLTSYLLYDGHGSTRQLADATANITAQYSFDAYGHMLGTEAGAQPQQATSLLYSGEQFDTGLQNYYLRARYYNQSNGRFNRLDPFAGSRQDPQSLHKYAYCHNEPVNGTDPSGLMTLIEMMTVVSVISIILVSATVGYKMTGTLSGAIFGGLAGVALAISFWRSGGFPTGFWGVAKSIAIGVLNVILYFASRALIEERLGVEPLSRSDKREAIVRLFTGGAWASVFPFSRGGALSAGAVNSIIVGWDWRSDAGIEQNLIRIGADAIAGAMIAYIAFGFGIGVAYASGITTTALTFAFAEAVAGTVGPLLPTVISDGAKEVWKKEHPRSYRRIYGW